jgi:hypothetical protein
MKLVTSFNAGRMLDAKHFVLSLRRLHPDVPVHCFSDVEEDAWGWFGDRGCILHRIQDRPVLRDLRKLFRDKVRMKSPGRWWTMLTPWLLSEIGGKFLYVQPDCIFLRPVLDDAEAVLASGPLLTSGHPGNINPPALYRRYPTPISTGWLTSQSGVAGMDLEREKDAGLLHQWKVATHRLINAKDRRETRHFEQGALLWAIHKCGLSRELLHSYRWNCPRSLFGNERNRYQVGPLLYDRITAKYDGVRILHFADAPKLSQVLFKANEQVALGDDQLEGLL